MREDSPAETLRRRLASPRPIVCPGIADGVAAHIAAARGFEALYVSGAGTAATRGLPDMGLLTLTELVDTVRVIAHASGLPVVVDADTGFGDAVAIRRTLAELADAGAAAIQLEDQPFPRRCGYLTSEPPVPLDQMLGRLAAARAAGTGLVLIARTDALLTEGFHSAVERAVAYRDAGADLVMVNGIRSLEELEQLAEVLHFPQLYNVSGSDRSPILDLAIAERLNVRIVIYPIQAARAAALAVDAYLSSLTLGRSAPDLMGFEEFMDHAGWSEARNFEDSVLRERAQQ